MAAKYRIKGGSNETFLVLQEYPLSGLAKVEFKGRVAEIPIEHVHLVGTLVNAEDAESSDSDELRWIHRVGFAVPNSPLAYFKEQTVGSLYKKPEEDRDGN